MARLPGYVYLIMAEGQWPVAAVAGDHPGAPDEVLAAVAARSGTAGAPVRVWKVSLAGAVPVDAIPPREVPAELAERPPA